MTSDDEQPVSPNPDAHSSTQDGESEQDKSDIARAFEDAGLPAGVFKPADTFVLSC